MQLGAHRFISAAGWLFIAPTDGWTYCIERLTPYYLWPAGNALDYSNVNPDSVLFLPPASVLERPASHPLARALPPQPTLLGLRVQLLLITSA